METNQKVMGLGIIGSVIQHKNNKLYHLVLSYNPNGVFTTRIGKLFIHSYREERQSKESVDLSKCTPNMSPDYPFLSYSEVRSMYTIARYCCFSNGEFSYYPEGAEVTILTKDVQLGRGLSFGEKVKIVRIAGGYVDPSPYRFLSLSTGEEYWRPVFMVHPIDWDFLIEGE